MKNIDNANNQQFPSSNEEIDLRLMLNFFVRNKLIVGSLSILFMVLFSLYSLTLKKIWEGQFQIVLKTEATDNNLNISSQFTRFIDLPKKDDLNTQVAILESPSLLEPIFQFVSLSKQKKGYGFNETYLNWKKNSLEISLKPKTSVLSIKYTDQDKELIIPVLEKMTYAFQEYSGKNIKRIQELTKKYLKDQITFFKKKSSLSLKAAQDFAIEQDLSFLSSKRQLNDELNDKQLDRNLGTLLNIDIENIRVKAANEIRIIDNQLKKIDELKDSEELQYIGSTIPALVAEGLPQTLKNIEEELVEMRSKYTDKDINIINLLDKRKLTLEFLKDRTIKYLKAYRLDVEAKMEAAMRPKGVILKYKELIREASRDESTLISLENQLRIIELEEAKRKDPWELITKPNVLNNPVAPSKTKIGLLGLIIGFLVGTFTSLYKEKKSDIIFESQKIEEFLNSKVVETLNMSEITKNSEKIIFIKSLFKLKKYKKVFIIYLNDNSKRFEKIIEILKENSDYLKEIKLISQKELIQAGKTDGLFLIASPNSLKYSQIHQLTNRISVFDLNIEGIIIY